MASSGATIRVSGLKEAQRAFKQCEGNLKKQMLLAGKAAAEPVAVSARSKLDRYNGISLNTIVPRSTMQGAFVTQKAKKVTGLRGDFGALQMTVGLMPALEENTAEIIEIYDHALGALTAEAGF